MTKKEKEEEEAYEKMDEVRRLVGELIKTEYYSLNGIVGDLLSRFGD